MGFNTHYLEGKSLAELCTFVRVDKTPSRDRTGRELWMNLPHQMGFPLYTVVEATPLLVEFINDYMIYKGGNLDTHYYLQATNRPDGVLITLKYQQIIGQRMLTLVPLEALHQLLEPHTSVV